MRGTWILPLDPRKTEDGWCLSLQCRLHVGGGGCKGRHKTCSEQSGKPNRRRQVGQEVAPIPNPKRMMFTGRSKLHLAQSAPEGCADQGLVPGAHHHANASPFSALTGGEGQVLGLVRLLRREN